MTERQKWDLNPKRERMVFEALRDVLEALRELQLPEHRFLEQIVQAEIVLAHEAERLGESFPNLRYVQQPQFDAASGAHCNKPSCPRTQSGAVSTGIALES
jgi:hypothetical protein